MLMAGCASGNSAEDVYNNWRKERAFSESIEKAYASNRALTLEDVTYKSELKSPALATSVNSISAVVASIYLTVVKNVDDMAACNNGRTIVLDIEEALENKEKPTTREKEIAELSVEDKKDLAYYLRVVNGQDQKKILDTVVLPLIKKLGEESEKIAKLAVVLKNNPEFKKLAGLQAMKEGKAIVADADALATQVADASTGLLRWKDQLIIDIKAKDKASKYPKPNND